MFKAEFENTVSRYSSSIDLFSELESVYGHPGRYYHNLSHLNYLVAELKPYQNQFSCWDTIVFAIAYHDFVYDVARRDNEEKSAQVAEQRLQEIEFSNDETKRCAQFILATQKHEPVQYEIDLFTDADLAILGADKEHYLNYAADIRKEYSIYPDLLYKPGRKKVLNHFLQMNRIYKSEEFFAMYERVARKNLQAELESM